MIYKDYPLSFQGTYQVGGNADVFTEANSTEDLIEALKMARESGVNAFVFGSGTNLVFHDDGFKGVVIKMRMCNLEIDPEKAQIIVESGFTSNQLVKIACENSLSGLEEWAGLPGTIGGAVFGNAGCFGLETKNLLLWADVLIEDPATKEFQVKRFVNQAFQFSYRNSILKQNMNTKKAYVLRACFQLKHGNKEEIQAKMSEIMALRRKKQPIGFSAGSVFKNPSSEQSAGYLIEQCGLKNAKIGLAQVSDLHANFIVNTGGASAKDISRLVEMIQKQVFEKFKIQLECEIVFVPKQ